MSTLGALDHPDDVLFVSDDANELCAASQAGLCALLSVRPGNAPLPRKGFATKVAHISDYAQLPALAAAARAMHGIAAVVDTRAATSGTVRPRPAAGSGGGAAGADAPVDPGAREPGTKKRRVAQAGADS